MSEFDKKVYMVVQNIPCGYVMNYGMVAELAGYRTRSRQVGRALHNNPDPEHIPCHRVVMKDGSLTPDKVDMQKHLVQINRFIK